MAWCQEMLQAWGSTGYLSSHTWDLPLFLTALWTSLGTSGPPSHPPSHPPPRILGALSLSQKKVGSQPPAQDISAACTWTE